MEKGGFDPTVGGQKRLNPRTANQNPE